MLKKKQIVSSSMTNSQANLSVIGMFQVIQDALTELTGKLGIDGLTVKRKYDAFWVFAKTHVKIFKDIVWNENMHVTSFVSGMTLAKMFADVEVKNDDGEVVLYSRTEMCALDLKTERIRKVATVGANEKMISKRKKMDIEFDKFDEKDMPIVEDVKIRYSNIDYCHHTNNLEYVRLIMNTYSVNEIEQKPIKEIEINYLNQSYENDTLSIHKKSVCGKDLFLLDNQGKQIVKCEIIF